MKYPLDHVFEHESDLLAAVKEWIEPQERDGIVCLPIRDGYTIGYSDLFICVQGIFVVAELKDNIGTASPHQKKFVKRMQRAGAIGHAECRSVADVAALIEEAKQRVRGGG